MESKDLISIIVTIYNREKYLAECLDSIKAQTYPNYEVIMVDDGSTDTSIEIARKYTEDSRFKLIESEHVGFPEAKNIGLHNATGNYIIFLDSDDSAYPQWLEILHDVAIRTGAPIVTCGYDEYLEGTEKRKEPESEAYKKNLVPISEHSYLKMNLLYESDCSSYMWNKLIRKELYEGIVFKDQIALSDISTMYKIFHRARVVFKVHTMLVHYRRHKESMGYETAQKGLEYYKFRTGVLREATSFVWNNYPQSRRPVQFVMKHEFDTMCKVLGEDVFVKEIYNKEFDQVLHAMTPSYVNPNK